MKVVQKGNFFNLPDNDDKRNRNYNNLSSKQAQYCTSYVTTDNLHISEELGEIKISTIFSNFGQAKHERILKSSYSGKEGKYRT